jgi:hypothetical protein
MIEIFNKNNIKKEKQPDSSSVIKVLEDQPRRHGFVKSMTETQKKLFQSLSKKSDDNCEISSTRTESTAVIKTVRFEDQVKVRRTITRSSYSDCERRACWFNQEETNKILKSNLKLVHKMDEDFTSIERRYCVRGLERHTRIGNTVRQKNRSDAKFAVLIEQERQNQNGIVDEVSIALAYTACTSSSQLWACTVGLQDHREAQRYISESDLKYCNPCD